MEFAKEQENEEDDVGSLSTTFQWQRLPQDGRASVNHSDSIVYQLWASPFSPLSPPTISVCLTPDSWCPSTRCHCYEGLQINGVGTGTNSTNMTALFTSPDDTCSFLSLCWDLKNLWDWEIFEFPPLIYSTYLSYLLAFVNRFIPRSLVSWAYLPAAGWCHACWINQQVEKQCNGGVSLNHLFTSTLKKVLSVFVARDLKRICSCMYFVLGNLMHVVETSQAQCDGTAETYQHVESLLLNPTMRYEECPLPLLHQRSSWTPFPTPAHASGP